MVMIKLMTEKEEEVFAEATVEAVVVEAPLFKLNKFASSDRFAEIKNRESVNAFI